MRVGENVVKENSECEEELSHESSNEIDRAFLLIRGSDIRDPVCVDLESLSDGGIIDQGADHRVLQMDYSSLFSGSCSGFLSSLLCGVFLLLDSDLFVFSLFNSLSFSMNSIFVNSGISSEGVHSITITSVEEFSLSMNLSKCLVLKCWHEVGDK